MSQLMLIWDYDTPLARITSTKPYNYHFEKCLYEEENVNYILEAAKNINAKFTFATLGFGAEKSVYPFDVRHVIKKIYQEGHEIASHSWKHEWLPLLTKYQLDKTLERSKYILEQCIDDKDFKVKGFVLPHDRPMSWHSRFGFSLGDRGVYPFFPGASIDGVSKYLLKHQYKWVRVVYRPIWEKIFNYSGNKLEYFLKRKFIYSNGLHYVPSHYMECDETAIKAVHWAVKNSKPLVISAHPAFLTFNPQNMENFKKFIDVVGEYANSKQLEIITVSNYLKI